MANPYYKHLSSFDKETVDFWANKHGYALDAPAVVKYCKALLHGSEMELGEDEEDTHRHGDNEFDDGKGGGPSQQLGTPKGPQGKGQGDKEGKGGKGQKEGKGEGQKKGEGLTEEGQGEKEEKGKEKVGEEEKARQVERQKELEKKLKDFAKRAAADRMKNAIGIDWEPKEKLSARSQWIPEKCSNGPPVYVTGEKQGTKEFTVGVKEKTRKENAADFAFALDEEGNIFNNFSKKEDEIVGKLKFPEPPKDGKGGGGEQEKEKPEAPKWWVRRVFCRCPSCKKEKVEEEKVKGDKPEDPLSWIDYKEKECGCNQLFEKMGEFQKLMEEEKKFYTNKAKRVVTPELPRRTKMGGRKI